MALTHVFKAVAVLTMDGELIDYVGERIDLLWAKELASLISMIANDIDDVPKKLEIEFMNRKLILLIDPPLIRIGVM